MVSECSHLAIPAHQQFCPGLEYYSSALWHLRRDVELCLDAPRVWSCEFSSNFGHLKYNRSVLLFHWLFHQICDMAISDLKGNSLGLLVKCVLSPFSFDRTSSCNSCKWNELKQIPAIHLRSISSAMFAMGINLSPFTCTISSSPQRDLYWCWWSCSSFMMLFEHEEQPISMDRWHKNQRGWQILIF